MMWTILPARVRSVPATGNILLTIEAGKLVQPTGASQAIAGALWLEVTYRQYRGWVYANLLEELVSDPHLPDFDVVSIPVEWRNPNPDTARQYVVVDGAVKYNLCGPFCAAFVGKDSIKAFLDRWRLSAPAYYKLSVQDDKPVGLSVVDSMLATYFAPVVRFADPLRDPVAGVIVSPGRLQNILRTGALLIAGVKIGRDGKLNTGRIGHWVVLNSVRPFGVNDGAVEIYNPFPNRYETYSYPEFVRSMTSWGSQTGTWFGVG